jgi:transcriptional regulator with XRE-family HTH domain
VPPRSPAAQLGQHLSRRRQALGLSIEDAADRAGLTAHGVRAVEAGRGWPKHPASHLAALADALELPQAAVTRKLADDSVLRADVEARRVRGGLYGGPARRLRPALARSVSRARGTASLATTSGNTRHPSPLSLPAVPLTADSTVSTSTPSLES